MSTLNSYIKLNAEFRSSINLYLSLNKEDKINSFIPTKSSISILETYLEAVEDNKRQATILLGPYGKGKSHLLLVLLAIISLKKNAENSRIINTLQKKIERIDTKVAKRIAKIWKNNERFLPVLISGTQDDLSASFLIGISDALKKDGLDALVPETYYGHAIECIERWKKDYQETYIKFENELEKQGNSADNIVKNLKGYENESFNIFKKLYTKITAGGIFNPLVNEDVLPIYRNISEQLKEKYGYSGIYIVFDEFSKFIEGQNKKAAGKNMKMLQDICELAADSKNSQIFITMVAHKGIKEYGNYLTKEIINSFTGIEGRIQEIQFVTSTKNNYELIQNAIIKNDSVFSNKHVIAYINGTANNSFELPAFKSTFNLKDFNEIVLKGCYPLSPVSAYLLLNVSEKVAQNERTLFTFISKEEQGSMATYVKNHKETMPWVVNPNMVYDYFKTLFKKSVTNEFVHNEWLNSDYALSQIESTDEKIIVKTLALINIVNKPSELSSTLQVLALASGLENAQETITNLEKRGIIYKKTTDNTYIFKTRATSDARNEISKRKTIRSDRVNFSTMLSDVENQRYILPRKYNFAYSMTRFFSTEYMEVEEFLLINDANVFFDDRKPEDGKVLFLYKFTDADYLTKLEYKVDQLKDGRLILVYSDTKCEIENSLREYDAICDLKSDKSFFIKEENKVLSGELLLIEDEVKSVISSYQERAFSDDEKPWILRYKGKKVLTTDDIKLVDVVDDATSEIYDKTIVVNNELINKREILTAPIKKARLNIIEALLTHDEGKIEGYLKGTSADSTIYRALFENNGIYSKTRKEGTNEEKFINEINQFITSCGDKKRKLSQLIRKLTNAPYGIRAGVIPIYIAYCISTCKDDVVVYFSEKETQITAEIVVNMCKNADDFSLYISLENVVKEQYLGNLQNLFRIDEERGIQESRITSLYFSMQKWFRGLPQVTKNIRKQDKYFSDVLLETGYIPFKNALQAVDGNPYEAIFVDIPKAFKADNLQDAFESIKKMYKKLNGYYDYVCKEIIILTKHVIGDTKQDLFHGLKDWYERQSESAKNGLFSNSINELMRLASKDKSSSESDIADRLSKIVVGVYYDSWNDNSLKEYEEKLTALVDEIQAIESDQDGRNEKLTFTSKSGKKIEQTYDFVDEGTGVILKNIISDALDDFSDLQVNDKVAILLEMVEKALGQEN